MLMAALQKGHFGKGHLQDQNPPAGKKRRKTKRKSRGGQKTVNKPLKLKTMPAKIDKGKR